MALSNKGATIYQRFTYSIAAGAAIDVNCYGRFITILANSITTDPHLSIGGQVEYQIPAGISIDLAQDNTDPRNNIYTTLRFRNSSNAIMVLDFAISSGRIYDNRVIISTTTTLNTNSTPDTLASPAAAAVSDVVGAAKIAAAGANREYILQNNGANDIWVGDANISAATSRGIKIAPNTGLTLTTGGAVYAVCAAGLTSTLSIIVMSHT